MTWWQWVALAWAAIVTIDMAVKTWFAWQVWQLLRGK